MRNVCVVLGFAAAILSLILAVTPLFIIALIPAVLALIFGLIAFYIARKKQLPKKAIQLVFLLSFITLSIATFKSFFNTVEVGNTEVLIQKENESEQEAIQTLEGIEIDE
jgi:membrane protein implicated in regulation of membrane protease activity